MTVRTLRSVADLAEAGLVAGPDLARLAEVEASYAIGLPEPLAGLIDRRDPADPLARQYVPTAAERIAHSGETDDPIGDARHTPVPGIVHRYPDRVLLKVTATCPVYCRFCFRREHVGPDKGEALRPDALAAALGYIAADSNIFEIILTGGDPMMLSAARARGLTQQLEAISHVGLIRWHTRMPVTRPDRVTADYARAIRTQTKAVFVAIHANHAREFTPDAVAACRRLADQGLTLVSQSVLLRGVNDTVETLAGLMRAFLAAGIKPYYLHDLDAAPGTAHFRVPVEEGQALIRALRDSISGLGVPHYVSDIPGGVSKASLALPDVEMRADGLFARGRDGGRHRLRRQPV